MGQKIPQPPPENMAMPPAPPVPPDCDSTDMMCLQKLQNEIAEWSDKTFGSDVNNRLLPILHHLKKEIGELIALPYNVNEYADCLILLLDASRMTNINVDKLIHSAFAKMEINKGRKWGYPDENGVIEHLKESI